MKEQIAETKKALKEAEVAGDEALAAVLREKLSDLADASKAVEVAER